MYRRHMVAVALISIGLSGCGLGIPEVSEFWDRDYPGDPAKGTPTLTATAQIEYEIKQKVYCELRHAVQEAEAIPVPGKQPFIPLGWGVQMQLSLEVDESIAIAPGVSFTQVMPNVMKVFGVYPGTNTLNSVTTSQSFTGSLGATLSKQVFRTDKFNTYYSIKDLVKRPTAICQTDGKPDPEADPFNYSLHWPPATSSPLLIESNLGIKDWLIGAMYFNLALPSSLQPSPEGGGKDGGGKFEGKFEGKLEGPVAGAAKGTFEGKTSSGGSSSGGGKSSSGGGGFNQDSFSREIKFNIVSSGNITPTWKLVQVSANTGGTFFSAGRTRIHDLIITIGPPTTRTANDFLASQIGQSVRSGARSQ